ncbi:hypothetical protein BWQ96_08694 [Gracilariopsis chorda]|uniref:Uncharacterized protein n=1 Tax=Gracilariopsis chorda TaxID=448386 RepID=A0A2V3IKC8_9FLOR|nr:hypothetical protein BWQ96_08694 [Gracilariopsis chorda]|eukprot:PXF41580.1 hypothetical protein BWQ96_08694 [Gracilariopsis chorda]
MLAINDSESGISAHRSYEEYWNSVKKGLTLVKMGVEDRKVLRTSASCQTALHLVHSGTEGVDGIDAFGDPVKIFTDVVGFVGDYPAAAHTTDVMGHNAAAPCTLCNFRRSTGGRSSMYGFSTIVNTQVSAGLRTFERHMALRNSVIDDDHANRLDMRSNESFADSSAPLVAFQRELDRKRDEIPNSIGGLPVVSGLFDSYRSNVIAPDHLLTGVTKNVLDACFAALGSRDARLKADVSLCSALRDNGLIRQTSVYNVKEKKLHSMTLSGTYCLLLVAAAVFPRWLRGVNDELCELLEDLQQLVGLTFWWPTMEADGREACDYVWAREGASYMEDLQTLSKGYVAKVDKFWKKCAESGDLLAKVLDKPNLHRLIELYGNTIPAFGHARHFTELVFETAHQPLKRCVSRSNHHNAHVSTVEHCLSNDWQGRLACLHVPLPDDRQDGVKCDGQKLPCLKQLLLGREAAQLKRDDEEHVIVARETDEKLHRLFCAPVLSEIRSEGKTGIAMSPTGFMWRGIGKIGALEMQICFADVAGVVGIVQYAQNLLRAYAPRFGSGSGGHVEEIEVFKGCKKYGLRTSNGEDDKRASYACETLETGCVFLTRVREGCRADKVVYRCAPPHYKRSEEAIFAVLGFMLRTGEDPWPISFRCEVVTGRRLKLCGECDESCEQLVGMHEDMRRVGLYHCCNTSCEIDVCKEAVIHSERVLGGGMYRFQTIIDGYLARAG